MKLFSFLIFSIFLSSCSIGPKYVSPHVSVPAQWSAPAKKNFIKVNEAWWRNFHDPLLNELIEQDAVYNLNVKIARQRIEVAKWEHAVVSAQLFPSAGVSALPPSGTGAGINQLLVLATTLDPDLFGRIRQSKQALKANIEAAEAEKNFSLINLYAEIALSYLELREAQRRGLVTRQSISRNKEILQLTQSRYKKGQINYIPVAQQRGLVENQLAELEQNKALVVAIIHKIEVLTGSTPNKLIVKLKKERAIPSINQPVHLNVPSTLLRRRPDIIAAERRVASAHANIRVAKANFFPQINLGWLLGWQTQTLASSLLAIQNPDSTFFGTFNVPLFNLGLHRALGLRKHEKELAIINYRSVILQALHEVETQYNYYLHHQKSLNHFQNALKQKRLVLKLSTEAYEKGLFDFNALYRAEEEFNQAQLAFLHNLVAVQASKINLYKALGGGLQPMQSKS